VRPIVPQACLRLPEDVPLALPSEIVTHRPDVRVAQANFHAASALVGVAIANRLPLFNLTGNIGRTSSAIGNLANPAPQFLFWTIAGSVTQPVFDGFTLEQRQRAAEAGLTQAAEQYQSALVTAFQNVTDALHAIRLDATSVARASQATTDALENLCLTAGGFAGYTGELEPSDFRGLTRLTGDASFQQVVAERFGKWWNQVCGRRSDEFRKKLRKEAGKDNFPSGIDVVTSEQLYLTTRLSLVTARASRLMDVAALFQALGGGWWNRTGPGADDPRVQDADVRSLSQPDDR
jgi:outer membrane protein TolC